MSERDETNRAVQRAAKLFKGFRLRGPRDVTSVRAELPPAVIVMGELRGLAYEMPRGDRQVLYWHEFADGSSPTLAAGPERCELVLLGGRYRVTSRGIVDYTRSGREAAHASTLELIQRNPRRGRK
jgi:hypothetical protein